MNRVGAPLFTFRDNFEMLRAALCSNIIGASQEPFVPVFLLHRLRPIGDTVLLLFLFESGNAKERIEGRLKPARQPGRMALRAVGKSSGSSLACFNLWLLQIGMHMPFLNCMCSG